MQILGELTYGKQFEAKATRLAKLSLSRPRNSGPRWSVNKSSTDNARKVVLCGRTQLRRYSSTALHPAVVSLLRPFTAAMLCGPSLARDPDSHAVSPNQPKRAVSTAPQAQKREFDGTWMGANGYLAFFAHWLALTIAERPMTAHRQWLGLSQKPPASLKEGEAGPEKRPRASIKRRLLSGMGSSHRRFIPLESLEEQYAGNRKRRRLMYALRRHHTPGSYRGRFDAFTNEAFIFFQLVFDRCTPRRMRSHPPWFTCCYLALTFVTFAFMAGEYPAFIQGQQDRNITEVCADYSFGTGPDGLAAWVYRWNGCHRFEPSFMVLWGATYAPKIKDANQWWRWLSSILLADSFPHVAANAFLFACISLHVESRYGTRVTAFLVLIAGVGGNFFDASFRGVCPVIISAAGCTFGLVTLFTADFLLNFETVRYPAPRLVFTGIALVLFVLGATILGYPYRLTPVGGFLTALLPSLLFLPHAGSEVLEWMIAPLALITSIGFLIALPLYIYLVRFPHAQCGSLVL
ncbi:hypothetical protein WJX73_005520 [Symbiochloris irregularis]|uniref:RHOMBOID-like protein n=1 Tax=Symbiochloris irregularis TaxID=706552 RepID=A0AAW1PWI3_9CHLO